MSEIILPKTEEEIKLRLEMLLGDYATLACQIMALGAPDTQRVLGLQQANQGLVRLAHSFGLCDAAVVQAVLQAASAPPPTAQ